MACQLFALLFLSLVGIAFSYTPEALSDQITNLPGAESLTLTFNQFSGYLQIPGNSGSVKNMHYWFVESMNSPANDPLAFWTNGGPGCSGLIGFMTEMGPFFPNSDGTLRLNEYAYNKVSNMVYIESPSGVGFSYSDDSSNLKTGDAQTALDNYNLIQAFLVRFPEYSNSSLFISSESYGGHYMPTLAKQIVDSNTQGTNPILNFKGFAVGNPYTNPYSGTGAMLDTYWGHQLVPLPLWESYQTKCVATNKQQTALCLSIENQIMNSVGNLNPYALDYPVCTSGSSSHKGGYAQRVWMLNTLLGNRSPEEKKALGLVSTSEYEPCEENWSITYLNRADVKAAIHVKSTITWNECSNKVAYNTTDSQQVSTAPIYNYLIDGGFGLNILVYSGDDDGVCATIGTQAWIWGLGYTPVSPQWNTYYVNGQTAGFLTQWANTKLAFLTIHNAGHEVPTYQPEIALDMWTKYLKGEWTNK